MSERSERENSIAAEAARRQTRRQTLGIIGGGQLGRMLALAAIPLDVHCVVLDPSPDPPAGVAAEVICAPFDDRSALRQLASRCDVVTVELEHVPVDAMSWLDERVPVRPGHRAVAIAQDRLLEKRRFRGLGIPVAPFSEMPISYPALVKSRRGGYDGRGQALVHSLEEWEATSAQLGFGRYVVEEVVAFRRELSIIAARTVSGEFAAYPLVENHHYNGILRVTRAPAPGVTSGLQAEAEAMARTLLNDFNYVGVAAIELFDTDAGLVANEWAPRVHNSGHWTIEGAEVSQFEQHVRAVLGWPLGSMAPRQVSAMVNLIGGEPDPAELLEIDGVHLHRYGKEPRPGRKVGHVTVVGADAAEVDARLAPVLRIVAATTS